VPIVRTYVPFVAGIGSMPYLRFLAFSVCGALLWVCGLSLAGYWFGNIPAVKNNLAVVIVVIVALSVLPIALEFLKARLRRAPGTG
jgi:membrane-associated protein